MAETAALTPQTRRVLNAANAVREAAGLGPLRPDRTLTGVAEAYSRDLARRGLLDHYGEDGSGLAERLADVVYPYRRAGENLYAGPRVGQAVVAAWMDSPSHRAVLLSPHYCEAGLGVAQGRAGDPFPAYWTLVVGERARAC